MSQMCSRDDEFSLLIMHYATSAFTQLNVHASNPYHPQNTMMMINKMWIPEE